MIEVYLAMEHVVACFGGRFAASRLPSLRDRLDAVLRECLGGASRWRRPAVRVWLSGGWVDVFLIERVAGLKSWSEAEALALATASSQDVEIVLDAFPGEGDALALAVDRAMLGTVRTLLRRWHLRVASMRPWWALELGTPHAMRGGCAELLVAIDDDAVTMLVGDETCHRSAARHQPCPAQSPLQATVQRTALVHGVEAAAIRQVRAGAEWLRTRMADAPVQAEAGS